MPSTQPASGVMKISQVQPPPSAKLQVYGWVGDVFGGDGEDISKERTILPGLHDNVAPPLP